MSSVQRPSSIAENTKVWPLAEGQQMQMSTWTILGVLIVAFFVLKSFIYIKDAKRHGK